MPKTRREFSAEFKRETVALLESSGRPPMQVATGVGIESYHNRRRIHSALGYRTPEQAERHMA